MGTGALMYNILALFQLAAMIMVFLVLVLLFIKLRKWNPK